MPRRIVIHAGFHKTGTSTVQQFLRKNRKALMPALAIRLKVQMTDLTHAARGFSTWRDPLSFAKVATRFDALLADLPEMPKRTLVLSAEELSGHMPGRPKISDYSAAPELARLYYDLCVARFPQAEVAFYFTTRAQASWLESAYWEHVKSSSMILDVDTFAARYHAGGDLAAAVDAVRAAVPCRVEACALAGGANTIAPLLALCDVPDHIKASLVPVRAANTRLPAEVLLELLAANRAYPDREARKAAKQEILSRMQPT